MVLPNERSVRNSPPESESWSSSLPGSLVDKIVVFSEILGRFKPEMEQVIFLECFSEVIEKNDSTWLFFFFLQNRKLRFIEYKCNWRRWHIYAYKRTWAKNSSSAILKVKRDIDFSRVPLQHARMHVHDYRGIGNARKNPLEWLIALRRWKSDRSLKSLTIRLLVRERLIGWGNVARTATRMIFVFTPLFP